MGDGPVTVDTAADSVIEVRDFGAVSTVGASGRSGIEITIDSDTAGAAGDSTGAVTVTHKGGISVSGVGSGDGIRVRNDGKGAVTVTTGQESAIRVKERGIDVISENPAVENKGAVTVVHGGMISAGEAGIYVEHRGAGGVTVTTGEQSSITTAGGGADGVNASLRHDAGAKSDSGVTVTHEGVISATGIGIHASVRGGTVDLVSADSRDADSAGAVKVAAGEGSMITAVRHGIQVWHNGSGMFDVAVRGKVAGDSGGAGGDKYAGVHIATAAELIEGSDPAAGGGGTITVGSGGHVSGSGAAVRVDPYAGPVKVILEQDDDGFAGHIDGKILNPGKDGGTAGRSALTFHTRAGADGDLTALTPGTGTVERRGARAGVLCSRSAFQADGA